jgi:hypothetical protein
MPAPPFVDPESRELDTGQIIDEALPLAALVLLFGGLSLLPFLLGVMLAGSGGFLFTILAQFVLAVGAGVVLIYAVARGTQLAG